MKGLLNMLIVLLLVLTLSNTSLAAGLVINQVPSPFMEVSVCFKLQSREAEPITVNGFVVNRGNYYLQDKQFKPVTLNMGQQATLFCPYGAAKLREVVEVIVSTDKGDYTFSF